ncbi:hypothetical protein [Streptomyces sp. NPDC002845]
MTQSGQGEEPSARIPREGIVLPSDGGAPLLPGEQQAAIPPAPAPGPSWDQPWGPDQSAAPAPPPAQPWDAPGAPQQQWGAQGATPGWGEPQGQHASAGPMPPQGQQQPSAGALPPEAEGAQQGSYGGGQPWYGAQGYGAPGAAHGDPGVSGVPGASGASGQAGPMPPVAAPVDEGATQYIPPVAAAPVDEGATQYIPPVAAAPAAAPAPVPEAATQYLPPVGPGAMPPETQSEATQYLGHAQHPGAGPLPPTANPSHPDAEATQYIAPVPSAPPYGQGGPHGAPGGQQAPDVFDSLFRNEPGGGVGGGGGGGAGAAPTQHLPPYQAGPPPFQAAQPPYSPGGRAAARQDEGGGGRTRSRVPLIAVVGVGIAALGIGAGALLSGGGDDQQADNTTVAATVPAAEDSPSASASESADPGEAQAVALDKLLSDSGDSRSAVIKAVANVKACQNLRQAASDLRDAAKQRNGLVTRLSKLSVNKLPKHRALTTALNNAWKASAAADNHYAAWADQVAAKKGACKKGEAASTGRTQAGNRESGTASAEKTKAARLWNTIASKYGLTKRQAVQL